MMNSLFPFPAFRSAMVVLVHRGWRDSIYPIQHAGHTDENNGRRPFDLAVGR
jgi:hypothetical protein